MRRRTLTSLSGKTEHIAKLIERFAAAVEESQRLGRSASFTVTVDPNGVPTFTLPATASAGSDRERGGREDLDRAIAAARGRGRMRMAEILGGDDMLSADAFARLIGTSRVTVNAKRRKRQLLALEGARRGFRFPVWQVGEDDRPFAALPALFDRLGGDPWSVYRFLVQRHSELGGMTGREALRRGKSAEAIAAAESVARSFA